MLTITFVDEVPTELLILIFNEIVHHCTVSHSCPASTPTTLLASLPIRISSVCRRWRAVALVVPELWCFTFIPEPSAGPPGSTDATVMLFASRCAPLALQLDISTRSVEDTLRADFMLRRTADRLGKLTFRTTVPAPTCLTTPIPSSSTKGSFPRLESLRLISLDWVRDLRLRISAPALRSLECIAIVPASAPNELQSLRSLTLRELNVLRITRLAMILGRWSQLEELELHRFTLEIEEMEFQIPLRMMPKLRKLKFGKMGQDALRGTLALIDAPLLEEMIVENVEDPFGGWLGQSWASIPLREFEGLRTLKMHAFQSRDGPCNLESVLRAAPNVVHLAVSEQSLLAFSTIARSDQEEEDVGGTIVARQLEVLELDGETWPWDDVIAFVKRRSKTLQKVYVPTRFVRQMNMAVEVRAARLPSEINWKTGVGCT